MRNSEVISNLDDFESLALFEVGNRSTVEANENDFKEIRE